MYSRLHLTSAFSFVYLETNLSIRLSTQNSKTRLFQNSTTK